MKKTKEIVKKLRDARMYHELKEIDEISIEKSDKYNYIIINNQLNDNI